VTAEERLAVTFLADHPDDAARVVERADPADAAALLAGLEPEVSAEILATLGPTAAGACTAALPDEAFAAIVVALPLTAAAVAMRRLEASRREPVLARLGEERAHQLKRMLGYPENTAGALADPLVLAVVEDITVGEAQRRLRGSQLHVYYYLYVVARDARLVGTLSVAELMGAPPKATVASVMHEDVVRLDAHTSLATIGALPAWRDFDALPVVDSQGHYLGAIRHKTVRRMVRIGPRPMMDTIVELSELYWVGLAGMLRSLAPFRAPPGQDESREGRKDDHVSH
jgi:magnesium transporter